MFFWKRCCKWGSIDFNGNMLVGEEVWGGFIVFIYFWVSEVIIFTVENLICFVGYFGRGCLVKGVVV